MAAPRPPKIPPKYWMYGLAVAVPIVQGLLKLAREKFTPAPKHCPKCSYQMVTEVGRRVGRRRGPSADGERRDPNVTHYWRCSACAARYRSVNEGPFRTPSDDEWARSVPFRFPR